MPLDDLQQYADSNIDFYELLGIPTTAGTSEIRKAWRKTSLRYHPDKNPDPSAVEKFHLLQIAVDVLCDEEARQLYDTKRAAKEAQRRQNELLAGNRRKMKEDLERAEGTAKRKRDDEEDEQHRLDMEIRRLAEDGKRRRKEREEQLRRERLEEEVKADEETEKREQQEASTSTNTTDVVSELDRSVKVRWSRDGTGEHVDDTKLSTVLARFGEVDAVFLLKDKKKRIDGVKRVIATGVIVFKSIVGAHAAVTDSEQLRTDEPWIEEVFWAKQQGQPGSDQDKQHRPPDAPIAMSLPAQPGKLSFGLGAFGANTTRSKAQPDVPTFSGASLEEVTMMRLKNAEKKRLEKQIREREAAEDAGTGDSQDKNGP